MEDMKIGGTSRWEFEWNQTPAAKRTIVFLGQVGPYDIYHDRNQNTYTVAKERTSRIRESYAFTEYANREGNLVPEDACVVLDPYHMCLLYQLAAAVGDPVKSRTGAK